MTFVICLKNSTRKLEPKLGNHTLKFMVICPF